MNDKAKKIILLVEDDESLQGAINIKLEQLDHILMKAANGVEALELSTKTHPDLIILDIVMPKMDGLEFLKKIRQEPWGAAVPVIILSNVSSPKEIAEAMEQNVFNYYIKTDISMSEIKEIIEEKLGESV